MHDIKNIAIIGSGQLGSRHLQALARITIPVEIEVIDPSPESLKIAEERFKEIPFNPNVKNIYYFSSINDLHSDIDFCIVATNSDVRAIVVEELLLKKRVEYLILEKVLFQTEGEYETIGKLVERYKVKTWVNCPRRMWPVYKEMHDDLMGTHLFEINFSGSDWGLASSSIHMIDLIGYLTGTADYNINGDLLDSEVVESKRKGFVEFTGTLKGSFRGGPYFSISSYKEGNVPLIIQLITEKSAYIISEYNGRGWVSREDQSWAWQEFSFETPHQSQLTSQLMQQIIDTGSSDLPSFEESANLHIPLLNCFISFLPRMGKEVDRCPIT
jgi:predicted dehydrogenase